MKGTKEEPKLYSQEELDKAVKEARAEGYKEGVAWGIGRNDSKQYDTGKPSMF
jgi:hypothetical protein